MGGMVCVCPYLCVCVCECARVACSASSYMNWINKHQIFTKILRRCTYVTNKNIYIHTNKKLDDFKQCTVALQCTCWISSSLSSKSSISRRTISIRGRSSTSSSSSSRSHTYVVVEFTWSFSSSSMFCFFSCTLVFSSLSSRSESSSSGPESNISSCRTWYSTSYACSCFEMSTSITWQSTGHTWETLYAITYQASIVSYKYSQVITNLNFGATELTASAKSPALKIQGHF